MCTLVAIVGDFLPDPLALPQAGSKLALVEGPVLPEVLAIPLGLAVPIVPFVAVSIFELLDASSVLEEAAELPLVSTPAVVPGVDAIAVDVAVLPLAHVAVGDLAGGSRRRGPDAAAVLFVG